jgi:hypothetical protein
MDKDVAIALMNQIQENWGEARLYEDYSGRGMFGATTTGLVVDSVEEAHVALGVLTEIGDEDLDLPGGFRSDNLGLSYIIY